MTLARFPGEDAVTVDEVVLLPGEQALLAPAWVPWHERLRPGDLSVGDVLPSTEDDPRLVPAYTADDASAEDPEGSVAVFELGLGRERVMSREGRGLLKMSFVCSAPYCSSSRNAISTARPRQPATTNAATRVIAMT